MPHLRIILNTPRGGAEVWDEEIAAEYRPNGLVAIKRQGGSDLVALNLAVGRTVWISETPQSHNAEYSILGKDGQDRFFAQLK